MDKSVEAVISDKKQSKSHALILDAAKSVFAKKGRSGARIKEIVSASGVNVRMIYHHFGSKEGLYDEVIRSVIGPESNRFPDVSGLKPIDGLRAIHDCLLDACFEDPEFLALLNWEAVSGWNSLFRAIDEQDLPFVKIIELVTACQKDGSFRDDLDPQLVATCLLGNALTSHHLAQMDCFADLRTVCPTHFKSQLWDLFTGGLTVAYSVN